MIQQADNTEHMNKIKELEKQLQSLRRPGKFEHVYAHQQSKDRILSEIYNYEYLIKTVGYNGNNGL